MGLRDIPLERYCKRIGAVVLFIYGIKLNNDSSKRSLPSQVVKPMISSELTKYLLH